MITKARIAREALGSNGDGASAIGGREREEERVGGRWVAWHP